MQKLWLLVQGVLTLCLAGVILVAAPSHYDRAVFLLVLIAYKRVRWHLATTALGSALIAMRVEARFLLLGNAIGLRSDVPFRHEQLRQVAREGVDAADDAMGQVTRQQSNLRFGVWVFAVVECLLLAALLLVLVAALDGAG